MFSNLPLLHAGTGASLGAIWGQTCQKSKLFAAVQHMLQVDRAPNGLLSCTIFQLRHAAKLTQTRYGTINQLATTDQSRRNIANARTLAHKNGTSINAQSGRFNVKKSGDHAKWNTPLMA